VSCMPLSFRKYRCKAGAVGSVTKSPVLLSFGQDLQRYLRKLKGMHDTRFQSYDPSTGTWVFEVDHFTKYGIDDDRRLRRATDRISSVGLLVGVLEILLVIIVIVVIVNAILGKVRALVTS
jgi:hypothetical protein